MMKDNYTDKPEKGYENKEAQNKAKTDTTPQEPEDKLEGSLRDQGLDKEQAAGIANTQDTGHGNDDAHVYENMSMEDLYEEAKQKGIDGYYDMRRNDIVTALKQQRSED